MGKANVYGSSNGSRQVGPSNQQIDSSTIHSGVPSSVTMGFVRQWVRQRVSAKRFRHTEGVVSVAVMLAGCVSCDQYLAELAAWLHDACKEIKARELVTMARELGLEVDSIHESHGNLLHGPVAAGVVKAELGITNKEVLMAISEHTLGATPMGSLSRVLFLADCLEEMRPQSYTDPIWAALDLQGSCDLDNAIVIVCDLNMQYLIQAGKPIHPRTIAVRNYYLDQLCQRI